MLRVVGTDPGTSSLDLLLLGDGAVVDQVRLQPEQLRDDPEVLVGPAGTLVADRPGRRAVGVRTAAGPGRGVHRGPPRADVAGPARRAGARLGGHRLPVVGPGLRRARVRRWSSCRAASTCRRSRPTARWGPSTSGRPTRSPSRRWRSGSTRPRSGGFEHSTFAVVEVGSAFTAILVVYRGQIVDASAGTRGPIGLRSGGAWDGEVAYWRSPLSQGRPVPRRPGRPGRRSGRPPFASRSSSMPPPCRR